MESVLNINDPTIWGVEAHGGVLYELSPYKPSKDLEWTIDIENNLDGSFASCAVTTNGRDIHYYEDLPKDFFTDVKLVGHGVKYDVQKLREWGFKVEADQIVWDTMVAEYVRDSTRNRYGLKDTVKDKFGIVYPDYKTLCGTGKKAVSIGTLPRPIRSNYNGMDSLSTHRTKLEQQENMSEQEIRYMNEIELPTLRVLLEMEERGVQIDSSYLRSLDVRLTSDIGSLVESIRHCVGAEINLNSHQQLKQSILAKAGIALQNTSAEELQKHDTVPLIKDILRYRQLNKLKGTYTGPLVERSEGKDTYRLHARFNQCVTHTGRLSSSDPNLQNIPTRTEEGDEIRGAFIAKEGHVLIDGDFSQIEPRIMAHFSEDENLKNIFINGEDLYDSVAEYVGCDRRTAKILWLAIAYNAGAFKIGKTANIGYNTAQEFINMLRETFPQLFYWKDKTIRQAEIDGYVETLFGRRIPLKPEWAHLAPNYKVQGSAAEVMKLAIISTREYNPVLTVHDELAWELLNIDLIPKLDKLMTQGIELSVPLKTDFGHGPNWRAAKN